MARGQEAAHEIYLIDEWTGIQLGIAVHGWWVYIYTSLRVSKGRDNSL